MHYIVIPTYQERDNIEPSVTSVLGLGPEYRVIVVDDASTDGTKEKLASLAAAYPDRLTVIHRPAPRSFAGSYIDGFRLALSQGDCESVIEFDADGSHPFRTIPELVRALSEADVAIGSRYVPGGDISGFPTSRLLLSAAANIFATVTTGIPARDITAGFVAYRADFLRALPYHTIASNGYAFQLEMKWLSRKANGRMTELPITFVDRSKGHSKMSMKTTVEGFVLGLRYLARRLFG